MNDNNYDEINRSDYILILKTPKHVSCIDFTKVENILAISYSWYQTLNRALYSFVIVKQSSLWSLCLIIAYRFSLEIGSGEFPGNSKSSRSLTLF